MGAAPAARRVAYPPRRAVVGERRRRRVLIVGTSLSRVYLGVHWPTDIVQGWLLGRCTSSASRHSSTTTTATATARAPSLPQR
ncbi:MAG: phosphatase PAP2 family protein [Microbacteriaceae bacterium]